MLRLTLISIGKLKDAHERALLDRYRNRIQGMASGLGFSELELREFSESRAKSADLRKHQEADTLLTSANDAQVIVTLDERGKPMTSPELAQWLASQRDDGIAKIAFLVGGPDGHHSTVREKAQFSLTMSAFTLPHGLARILFTEQLYRAMTILSGHPYHRE